MRIGIVDDDQEFTKILINEIAHIFPDNITTTYQNMSQELYQEDFDIIFLDVLLYNHKSFEDCEKLLTNRPNTILVYISSIEHFVYDSYRQNSFFFIRKSKLHEDIMDFSLKYKQKKQLENQILTITSHKKIIDLLQRDIICIQSNRNKAILYTTYTKYIVYLSLTELMKKLDHICFYKLNSYTIVNLDHILEIEDKDIILTKQLKIDFTRNSKDNFIKAYTEYRRNKVWNT